MAGSVYDNLALGLPAGCTVEEALAPWGGQALLARVADGRTRAVGELDGGLSGGQAQAVALARAFCAARPILLLDEPTAHFDADLRDLLAGLLRGRPRGVTVLHVSHDPLALAGANRVVDLARLTLLESHG